MIGACMLVSVLVILNVFRTGDTKSAEPDAVDLIALPVTFYLGDIGDVSATPTKYEYYDVLICPKAIQNSTDAELTIQLPNNPSWDTSAAGYVMAQVSKCSGSFSESCVIAQNYVWGAHVLAIPTISWKYQQETDYYIRVLAGNLPTQFSMELQFLSDTTPKYYNWTTDLPFSGSVVNKAPTHLYQYWKSRELYNVRNKQFKYFALAYCDEDISVTGIDVATATPPDDADALITQYACPQSIPLEDCTQSSALQYGWINAAVASFNLLECDNAQQRSTKDGIYVVVEGYGGDVTEDNHFTLDARPRA